jgi:hypothetical protein
MATFIHTPPNNAPSRKERNDISKGKIHTRNHKEDLIKIPAEICRLMSKVSKRCGHLTSGARRSYIQETLHSKNNQKQSCRDMRDTELMSEANASIVSLQTTE